MHAREALGAGRVRAAKRGCDTPPARYLHPTPHATRRTHTRTPMRNSAASCVAHRKGWPDPHMASPATAFPVGNDRVCGVFTVGFWPTLHTDNSSSGGYLPVHRALHLLKPAHGTGLVFPGLLHSNSTTTMLLRGCRVPPRRS